MSACIRWLSTALTVIFALFCNVDQSQALSDEEVIIQAQNDELSAEALELLESMDDLQYQSLFVSIGAGIGRAIPNAVRAAASTIPRLAMVGVRQAATMGTRMGSIFARTSKVATSVVQKTSKLATKSSDIVKQLAQRAASAAKSTGKVAKAGKSLAKEALTQGAEIAKGQLSSQGQSATAAPEQQNEAGQTTATPDQSKTSDKTSDAQTGHQVKFTQDEERVENDAASPTKFLESVIVTDKDYSTTSTELTKQLKLYFASYLKTNKAMQADKSLAEFQEVTSEEEADQLLKESAQNGDKAEDTAKKNGGEAAANMALTPKQTARSQQELIKESLLKPTILDKKTEAATKIDSSTSDAQKTLDKLNASLDKRAQQLQEKGLKADQMPPEDMWDDQEVKDILADLDAYGDDCIEFDTADDELDDYLFDDLDLESIDEDIAAWEDLDTSDSGDSSDEGSSDSKD